MALALRQMTYLQSLETNNSKTERRGFISFSNAAEVGFIEEGIFARGLIPPLMMIIMMMMMMMMMMIFLVWFIDESLI